MQDVFFWIFSVVTLAAAILVVTNHNAVNSAMFLIVTFLGMASLFVLLEAYFLAVIQVLVYAGAVVVLFVFIIMLLDVGESARRRFGVVSTLASVVAMGILLAGVGVAIKAGAGLPVEAPEPAVGASLKAFGYALFTTYLLPMQVTGFLLLVAMLGVIVLSKHDDNAKPASGEASH